MKFYGTRTARPLWLLWHRTLLLKFRAAEFCVEQVCFSSAEWFGTEFRQFASIFFPRNSVLFSLPLKDSEGNSESILLFLKAGWPDATFFSFISYSFIQTIHSHILTSMIIRRDSAPFPYRWTAQWADTSLGCRVGIRTRARADMLPTEPCRTLKPCRTLRAMPHPVSHAAP